MVDTTDQRIAEIKARADEATLGPWNCFGQHLYRGNESLMWSEANTPVAIDRMEDALFIAHAREDVPFLLQIVADLKEQVRYLANPLRHAAYSSAKWDAYLPQGVVKEAAASVALDGGTQFDGGAEAEARQMTLTVPDLGNSTDAEPKEDTDNGQ